MISQLLTPSEATALVMSAVGPAGPVTEFGAGIQSYIGPPAAVALWDLFAQDAADTSSLLWAAEHDPALMVAELYGGALGRAPERGAVAWWEAYGTTHGGPAAVIVGIALSPEAQAHAAPWLHW